MPITLHKILQWKVRTVGVRVYIQSVHTDGCTYTTQGLHPKGLQCVMSCQNVDQRGGEKRGKAGNKASQVTCQATRK